MRYKCVNVWSGEGAGERGGGGGLTIIEKSQMVTKDRKMETGDQKIRRPSRKEKKEREPECNRKCKGGENGREGRNEGRG